MNPCLFLLTDVPDHYRLHTCVFTTTNDKHSITPKIELVLDGKLQSIKANMDMSENPITLY